MATRLGTRRIARTPRITNHLHRPANQYRNRKLAAADAEVQACCQGPIRVLVCGYEDPGHEGNGEALAEFEDEGDAGVCQAGRCAAVSGGEFGVGLCLCVC